MDYAKSYNMMNSERLSYETERQKEAIVVHQVFKGLFRKGPTD